MRILILSFLAMSVSLLAFAQQPSSGTSGGTSARTVKVQVNYTGSGTVDEAHKIYVVLWDSPDFTTQESAMPTAVKAATSKDATVTFSQVEKSPVYASAAYDPTGHWQGDSKPPAGTVLALYGEGGTPTPINVAPGKTESIKISFDDSHKMQ